MTKDNSKSPKDQKQKKESQTKPSTKEFGGQKGPEPTRYNDWEKNGRVSDF
jgi:hypothetical protein